MTSHVGRLYASALALVVFFLTWVTVAAHPWTAQATARTDPRVAALAARQSRLRHESVVVGRIVRRRWAVYRRRLHRREQEIAAVKRANAAAVRAAAAARTAAAAQATAAAAAPLPAAAPAASAPPAAAPPVRVVTLPPVVVTRSS